jgi:hypothetical protein
MIGWHVSLHLQRSQLKRRMTADYSTMVQGISVFDILDSKQQPVSHELTSFARLTDDDNKIIIYPERM